MFSRALAEAHFPSKGGERMHESRPFTPGSSVAAKIQLPYVTRSRTGAKGSEGLDHGRVEPHPGGVRILPPPKDAGGVAFLYHLAAVRGEAISKLELSEPNW